jgi:hypothetical protein
MRPRDVKKLRFSPPVTQALECQREFGEMFRKAVVLFMLKERGVFDPIGSGTFVFHEGKLLIVSAAHVFEDLANKGQVYLHIGPINQIVKLNRIKIFTSSKVNVGGSRAKDALDLGVMVVPDEIIDICNGKILMIQEDLIENHTNTKSVQFYQAIGYPGVKNTKLAQKASRTNRLFTPEILIYSGAHKSVEEVSNEKFVDEHHVILDWNNKKTMMMMVIESMCQNLMESAVGLFKAVLIISLRVMVSILHAPRESLLKKTLPVVP